MNLPIRKMIKAAKKLAKELTGPSNQQHHNHNKKKNAEQHKPADCRPTVPQGAISLPLPVPVPPLHQHPWDVVKSGFGHQLATLVNTTDPQTGAPSQALCVSYKAGSVGSSSGFGFYATPANLFPANEAVLSYMVYFPPNYNWVKGGKLPGLYIGSPGASGGNWDAASGSARVVWKEGGKGAAYLYVPTCICGGKKEAVVDALGPEYECIAHVTKTKGHHIWKSGKAQFLAGQWNSVSLRVRMNTPGQRDGVLELIINGVRQCFDQMVWRTDPKLCIGGVCFVTFFGGSSPDAAAPQGAYKMFKDITIAKSM